MKSLLPSLLLLFGSGGGGGIGIVFVSARHSCRLCSGSSGNTGGANFPTSTVSVTCDIVGYEEVCTETCTPVCTAYPDGTQTCEENCETSCVIYDTGCYCPDTGRREIDYENCWDYNLSGYPPCTYVCPYVTNTCSDERCDYGYQCGDSKFVSFFFGSLRIGFDLFLLTFLLFLSSMFCLL